MGLTGWIDGVEGVLLDVDGTLLDGIRAIPGAGAAIDRLRHARIPFRLVTNTTRKPRTSIARTLHEAGIEVRPEEILVPASLAGRLIRDSGRLSVLPLLPGACLEDLAGVPPERRSDGARIGEAYSVEHADSIASSARSGESTPRIRSEEAAHEARSHEGEAEIRVEEASPDWVVVGDLGRGFTFERLSLAFHALRNGARLLALHRGRSWKNESGEIVLDAGPFVAALEYAAGVEARLVGKPARDFFDLAAAEIGIEPARLMMVGDDWTNDIEGGAAAGLRTALVLTGNASRQGVVGPMGRARSNASSTPGADRAVRSAAGDAAPRGAVEGVPADLVLDSIADLASSGA